MIEMTPPRPPAINAATSAMHVRLPSGQAMQGYSASALASRREGHGVGRPDKRFSRLTVADSGFEIRVVKRALFAHSAKGPATPGTECRLVSRVSGRNQNGGLAGCELIQRNVRALIIGKTSCSTCKGTTE
jgi:hypothetical protein